MPKTGVKHFVRGWFARRGYQIVREGQVDGRVPPADLDQQAKDLFAKVRDYTLTSAVRVAALRDSVRYVVRAGVQGSMVECGVWRGGSMMAVALTLLDLGVEDRDLYMYDTWTGMPEPGERDFDEVTGLSGAELQERGRKVLEAGVALPTELQMLSVDEVRAVLESTGYAPERMHFIGGLVEKTIPEQAPDQIAVLRLDTDYYSSTRHELEHLYPRVSDGGIVIIDDYGQWRGAREAVDEYLSAEKVAPMMHRIDEPSRAIVVQR